VLVPQLLLLLLVRAPSAKHRHHHQQQQQQQQLLSPVNVYLLLQLPVSSAIKESSL
jgi:hypothetical protein